MAATVEYANGTGALRPDEAAVRLVFVEHSADYAALVRETLEHAPQGRFEIRHAPRMDAALHDVEDGECDAVLVDGASGDEVAIDFASSLATRVPVIVLAGSDSDAAAEVADEALVLERLARSGLPGAILSAVRRSRRLGQCGAAEPIVWRDPLRAFARAFSRMRRSLSH